MQHSHAGVRAWWDFAAVRIGLDRRSVTVVPSRLASTSSDVSSGRWAWRRCVVCGSRVGRDGWGRVGRSVGLLLFVLSIAVRCLLSRVLSGSWSIVALGLLHRGLRLVDVGLVAIAAATPSKDA